MSRGVLLDLVSLGYGPIDGNVLRQLARGWRSLWRRPPDVGCMDAAWRTALFVFWPAVVLVHEAGHALAAWQVGAAIRSFNWRVLGSCGAHRPPNSLDTWWFALAGFGRYSSAAAGLAAVLPAVCREPPGARLMARSYPSQELPDETEAGGSRDER